MPGTLTDRESVIVERIGQCGGVLQLDENEELVSNIISIKANDDKQLIQVAM